MKKPFKRYTEKKPFERYIRKWPWDVSEYIRQLATNEILENNTLFNIINECYEKYRDITDEIKNKYKNIKNEGSTENPIQCDEVEIRMNCEGSFGPPFTKKPLKKFEICSMNYGEVNDSDIRATPIIGALRWALEKYTILYASLKFNSKRSLSRLTNLILLERESLSNSIQHLEQLILNYAKWFPPRVVFGGAKLDRDTTSYRSSVVVEDLNWDAQARILSLKLSIDPPPYVYLALRELGFAGREKAVISSLLGIAAVMLTNLESYECQVPVPLGEDSCREVKTKLCRDASYELAVEFIERAICNILKV